MDDVMKIYRLKYLHEGENNNVEIKTVLFVIYFCSETTTAVEFEVTV